MYFLFKLLLNLKYYLPCSSTEYKSGMKMKIPNGGSGNGYYGHESGVISYLDNVQSDANVPATAEDDFSEYMWMENEEEFDKQVNRYLTLNFNFIKDKIEIFKIVLK
jgi:hypothetical protein